MKRYTVIPEYDDKNLETLLSTIYEEFSDNFNVDLNAEKYWTLKDSGMKLEELWHQIVTDCFGDEQIMSPFEEADKFDNMLYELLQLLPEEYVIGGQAVKPNTDNSECIVIDDSITTMDTEYTDTVNDALSEIFNRIKKEFFSLPNQYSLYESGVWMDAAFAIDYIHSVGERSLKYDNQSKYEDAMKNINKVQKKREAYDYIPFSEEDLASGFCDGIKGLLMDRNRAQIFDTDSVCINKDIYTKDAENDEVDNIEDRHQDIFILTNPPLRFCRFNIHYPVERSFTCWSYPKISELENDTKLNMEDLLFFYQLTDSILIRNAAYEFTQSDIPLSTGRGLMGYLEMIESVSWRFFLLYFYVDLMDLIKASVFNVMEWKELHQYSPIRLSDFYDTINNKAHILARGLIYVYFNFKYMDADMERKYEDVVKKQLDVLRYYDEDLDKKFAEEREEYDKPRTKSIKNRRNKKRHEWEQNSNDPDNSIRMVMQARANQKLDKYGPRWKLITKKSIDYETESGLHWYYAFLQHDVIAGHKKPYQKEDQENDKDQK